MAEFYGVFFDEKHLSPGPGFRNHGFLSWKSHGIYFATGAGYNNDRFLSWKSHGNRTGIFTRLLPFLPW